MSADDLSALKKATEGVLYPSESDEPFEVFIWTDVELQPAEVIRSHVKKGIKVQEQPLEQFFADLQQSDDAPKFNELRRVLESSLRGAKVFRAGSVEIDVFVIGRTQSGKWAGLHTRSIET